MRRCNQRYRDLKIFDGYFFSVGDANGQKDEVKSAGTAKA